MLAISRLNYPGAEALNQLHKLAENNTGVRKVHMDTISCMTGVTRFLEQSPSPGLQNVDEGLFWVYDKTEDERKLVDPIFWEGMDYALTEHPERIIGAWKVIGSVDAFAGFRLLRPKEDIGTEDTIINESALIHVMSDVLQKRRWEKKEIDIIARYLQSLTPRFEQFCRRFVTRGWWIRLRMEPRIRILKKQKITPEDWLQTSDDLLEATGDELNNEP